MEARTLVPTAVAVTATAEIGGPASRPAESARYRTVRKSRPRPPGRAYPNAWSVLYADLAAVSASTPSGLERRGQREEHRAYIVAPAASPVLDTSRS